jgi:hypothetical protein
MVNIPPQKMVIFYPLSILVGDVSSSNDVGDFRHLGTRMAPNKS